jgi:hypothetical protein
MRTRLLPLFIVLLAGQTADAADDAVGCYGRKVSDGPELRDSDPVRLTDRPARAQPWIPKGAKVAEFVYPEETIAWKKAFWVRTDNGIEVTFTENGKVGWTAELKTSPSGFDGFRGGFNTDPEFVRFHTPSREVWTRQPCDTPLPPFPYMNTYDLDDRAILAFPKDTDDTPGSFIALNGRAFREPQSSAFVKPRKTKIDYYCKSASSPASVTLDLKPEVLYAFYCTDDVHARHEP